MITKQEALRLLENKFGGHICVPSLCIFMPYSMLEHWDIYWQKINTEKRPVMSNYFDHNPSFEERALLRLLVAHQFIEETYHD